MNIARGTFADVMRTSGQVPAELLREMFKQFVAAPQKAYLQGSVRKGYALGNASDIAASLRRVPFLDAASRQDVTAVIERSEWYRHVTTSSLPLDQAISGLLATGRCGR
jgi:hypothetical protein